MEVIIIKRRKEKRKLYEEKYSHIPREYNERIRWIVNQKQLSESKMDEIMKSISEEMQDLYYTDYIVILYEEPEGAMRPRFRLINRQNLSNMAFSNSSFVHVYSVTGKEDNIYMKKLLGDEVFILDQFIYTPCIIEYNAYIKTPSTYNAEETIKAEIGLTRPIVKPDWDNIGKKYSDMYNSNVWFDDSLVISGHVEKYYSILPRVEIKLRYLNKLYNKYQYNSMKNKLDFEIDYFGKEK